jgi:hypothetical protein
LESNSISYYPAIFWCGRWGESLRSPISLQNCSGRRWNRICDVVEYEEERRINNGESNEELR